MKRIPKNYFSISSDGKKAVAMLGGVPANMAMDFEECRKYYGKECHPSFAWQNSHWVSI